jgi:transposase-like protein
LRELSRTDLERKLFMHAFLSLPLRGVRIAFPTEADCAARLADVRFPNGAICPRCHDRDVGFLEGRQLYFCRSCSKQFSVKSGTIAHRSRLALRMWFIAAEDIITAYAKARAEAWLTGHDLAERYQISYAAAYRLKQCLLKDLTSPSGIFKPSVCVNEVIIPPDVTGSDHEIFSWLIAETMSRT